MKTMTSLKKKTNKGKKSTASNLKKTKNTTTLEKKKSPFSMMSLVPQGGFLRKVEKEKKVPIRKARKSRKQTKQKWTRIY